MPAPDSDEFYFEDLVGLNVIDESQTAIGTVIAIHDFGAGEIVEIKLVEDADPVMVPFTSDDFPDVDLEAGRLVLATLHLWDGTGDDPDAEG